QFLTINGSLNGETLWIGDDTYKYLIEVRENGKYSEILKLMSYKNSIEFITQRESNDFNKIRVEILTNSIVSITLKIGNSTAIVNEKEVFLDTAPILENGRTLVPIRFISESIGANVKWNDKDLSIVITLGDKKIYLWIGKKESIIEKKGVKTTYKLDVPPRIVNNRTLVPLRFVMEAFSATVTWIDEYKLIKINYYK
ncbi:MAG: copper amine oxidase N-terminal domain-containing protein, partial [Caldisericia bacterium]|nr:copper amine oxidase N-terminal domain-containing protein [Caldisericia bacterium]